MADALNGRDMGMLDVTIGPSKAAWRRRIDWKTIAAVIILIPVAIMTFPILILIGVGSAARWAAAQVYGKMVAD